MHRKCAAANKATWRTLPAAPYCPADLLPTYERHPFLISPIQRESCWLIKLTFWQQSVLNDASLEQQTRQQQAEGNQDVDEGRRGSAVCPKGSKGAAT